jgi:microcystin-dependent protein
MTISAMTPFSVVPQRLNMSKTDFAQACDTLLGTELPRLVTEWNANVPDIALIPGYASTASAAAATAAAAAAYKGPWSSLSGPLAIPATVSYSGKLYVLLSNLADVTTKVPGVASEWLLFPLMADPTNVAVGKALLADGAGGTTFDYAVRPGSGALWFTDTPPTGWLECDGSSLLRAGTYAALFAAIGTTYGAADGTHFNLPDLRGRFPRFWAHGSSNDPDRASRTALGATGATMTAGDHVGTLQADQLKAHTHGGVMVAGTTYANGSAAPIIDAGSTGSTGGNETRPLNVNVMPIIKF